MALIPLTAEQSRALIDAVATADTLEELADLRRVATRERLLDVRGGFLELLIELRQDTLTRMRANRDTIA
jgi:hypothetical protein